ncbi:MAG: hypothetical protein M3Q29_25775 [Chloroflexota bacterium]|nr:hypothetical protein [Chloroflexota bacterium]
MSDEVLSELRELRQEVQLLRAEQRAGQAEIRTAVAEFRLAVTGTLGTVIDSLADLRREYQGHTHPDPEQG